MKQSILAKGDLVRYKRFSPEVDNAGFVLGAIYEVQTTPQGSLVVRSSADLLANLVTANGELALFSDYFAKVQCPLVLPRGLSNGQ